MDKKRTRVTDSPAVIPHKLPNNAGAFVGGQTSPVSSKSSADPLAAAIAKVKEGMAGKECDGPEWATVHLVLAAFEQVHLENVELRRMVAAQQVEIGRLAAAVATTTGLSADAEEKERRRSIVISGLSECAGKPSERRAADKCRLDELIDELDVDADVVTTYRMGVKKEGGRPRLLKVVLGSSRQQQAALRSSGKLKSSAVFAGVFVRASLTQQQREEDYRLRKEVRERRALGERVRIVGWPGEERKIVTVQGN